MPPFIDLRNPNPGYTIIILMREETQCLDPQGTQLYVRWNLSFSQYLLALPNIQFNARGWQYEFDV